MNVHDFTVPGAAGDFIVYNVTPVSGGDSFLFVSDDVSFVYDTGFGFSSRALYENVKKILQDRSLDYILLTHSHYDHAMGSACLASMYPSAKVIGHPYAAGVFQREGARRTMKRLDDFAASLADFSPNTDYLNALHIDIEAEDGTELMLGSHKMQVVGLPGHTKDSIGFFFPEFSLLLGTESSGVIVSPEKIMPAFLVSYDDCIDSINRCRGLNPKMFFVPHRGIIEGKDFITYINNSLRCHSEVRELILDGLAKGYDEERIFAIFKDAFYSPEVQKIYPLPAFHENACIMIRLLSVNA